MTFRKAAFILETKKKYDFILEGIAIMELILHKVCGHPAQQAVTLRRCTPDEAPAVYALQNEVHAAMPHPEWCGRAVGWGRT